jgi:hypothetical protein
VRSRIDLTRFKRRAEGSTVTVLSPCVIDLRLGWDIAQERDYLPPRCSRRSCGTYLLVGVSGRHHIVSVLRQPCGEPRIRQSLLRIAGALVRIKREIGVDTRRPVIRVAHPLLDRAERSADGRHLGAERVPQVVEPHRADASPVGGRLEALAELVRIDYHPSPDGRKRGRGRLGIAIARSAARARRPAGDRAGQLGSSGATSVSRTRRGRKLRRTRIWRASGRSRGSRPSSRSPSPRSERDDCRDLKHCRR